MNALQLRIVNVDMNGYWGRELHPQKTDNGLVVTVVAMECRHWDSDGNETPVYEKEKLFLPALPHLANPEYNSGGQVLDGVQYMFVAVTEDGRILQLMDHEVEVESPLRWFVEMVRDETDHTTPAEDVLQLDILRDKATKLLNPKEGG